MTTSLSSAVMPEFAAAQSLPPLKADPQLLDPPTLTAEFAGGTPVAEPGMSTSEWRPARAREIAARSSVVAVTKLRQEDDAYAAIRDLRNRVRKLETHAPQALAFKDTNSHTRVVIGALDVLGGGYVRQGRVGRARSVPAGTTGPAQ